MKRHVLTLVFVSMVAVACTASEDPAPSPPPDAMPPTPTEVETDNEPSSYSATEIPAVEDIDLAYVQWVIADAITPVIDEAIRIEVEAGLAGASDPPPVIFDMYGAVAGGEHLQSLLGQVSRAWESETFDRRGLAESPQPVVITVLDVLDAADNCIIATFERDLSPRLEQPTETRELIALLEPKPSGADADAVNASPWRIVREGLTDSVTGTPQC